MIFECVSEHFQTFDMSKEAKLVFRAWMHYFEVPMLWEWFRNEINYPSPIDPKRCLRVFWSISQTFGTSNEAKLMFRAWMHYFGVSMLRKWFRNEINHSTPVNPKWYLSVFRSISQTFGTSKEAKLVFRAWMHYFREPKLRKWYHHEINHSTLLDPKRCFRVFWSI